MNKSTRKKPERKEEWRKKRENEIKSQLFTDDVFNNIQVPEIKPIVKKEEKLKEEKEQKKDYLFEIKVNKTENYEFFGDESKDKESESTSVKDLFGIDIKPRPNKVFDTSLFAETPKPATIVSGLFDEGAPKKTNSLFGESPEKKGKKENKDKKGVTTLFDESTPKAKKHLFDDNYDMPIKPAAVKKQKKNLFDDEPEKPAQKKSMKIIKKSKKTLFDGDEDHIFSKAKPKKEETKKKLLLNGYRRDQRWIRLQAQGKYFIKLRKKDKTSDYSKGNWNERLLFKK